MTLTEMSPFEAKLDEQKSIETLQPACQDENHANAYVQILINIKLNLLL